MTMTEAEAAAPELPDLPPADVTLLRGRIRDMDAAARDVFLQRWTASGLGPLADAEGNGLVLPIETFKAIEQLVADHEPPAPDGAHAWLVSALADMAPGPMRVTENRLLQQFAENVLMKPLAMTLGRYTACGVVIRQVQDEAEDVVAGALGPVADPVGDVITTPVADAAALADALPAKAKVAEVLAWVGADLGRARFALAAEQARPKPRDGVVNKLAPLVGGEAIPPASTPAAAEAEETATLSPLSSAAEEVSAPSLPPVAAAPPSSAPSSGEVVPGPTASPDPDAGVQLTVDDVLSAEELEHLDAFANVPADQWGPLTTIAYLRRLAANAEAVARKVELSRG